MKILFRLFALILCESLYCQSSIDDNKIFQISSKTFTIDDTLSFSNSKIEFNNFQKIGELDSCVFFNVYDQSLFIAAVSSTWSVNDNPLTSLPDVSTITIRNELRIPEGVNITINGLTIKFAPNAKLIIENGGTLNGGRLTLTNGAKLTVDERCGTTWQGVEVWGQSNLAQNTLSNSKQGALIITGNSIIEKAMIGVLVSKRISAFTFDDNYNGGIVRVKVGNFINNQRSVWFRNFNSDEGESNISFFNDAKFLWNNDFISSNLAIKEHVRLEKNTGIVFQGVKFNNEIEDTTNINYNKGKGIVSISSHFIISDYCSGFQIQDFPCINNDKSSFSNLEIAIRATSNNSIKSFLVNNTEFIDNKFGIYSSGVKHQKITNNSFFVREDSTSQSAGVALYSATGYTIEGNTFEEFDNTLVANGTGQSYGIVINNSGTDANVVYRNTFSKLKVGGLSEGINGETHDPNSPYFNTIGLQWFCNIFNAPIYQTDLGVNGIIAYQQGYPISTSEQEARKHAARNKFSLSGESSSVYPNHDIWATPNSQSINYVYLADQVFTPDNYNNTIVYISKAKALGIPVYSTVDMCPSKLDSSILSNKLQMLGLKTQISAIKIQLEEGESEQLRNTLATLNNKNSMSVYDELLSKSPYLTVDILKGVLDSDLDPLDKFSILVANSPLNKKISELISASSLESIYKDDLLENYFGESPRQTAEAKIKYLESDYTELHNVNIKDILFNEENYNMDSLKLYLEGFEDEESKKLYYDILISKKETQEIETYKNETIFSDNDEFIKLQDVKEQLALELNEEEKIKEDQRIKAALEELQQMYTKEEISLKAQAILEKVEGLYDVPNFEPLFAPLYRVASPNNEIENLNSSSEYFQIYPNPANDNLTVLMKDYTGLNLVYDVYDIRGFLVQSFKNSLNLTESNLDLSELKSGIYILKINDNQMNIENLKFIVKK